MEFIQRYEEIKLRLQQSFEDMKKRVFLELERISINNDRMLMEIGQIKNLYKINHIPPL